MLLCLDKMLQNFKILNAAIVPRAIAWAATSNEDGGLNLAPFSLFGVLSVEPVIFSICLTPKGDGEAKDTLKNALRTGKASIAMCDLSLLPAMDKSAQALAHGESEATEFNIPLESLSSGFPAVPKGAQVAFFCTLYDTLKFEQNTALLLRAESCYIKDGFYRENLDLNFRFISRVGDSYHTIGSKAMV